MSLARIALLGAVSTGVCMAAACGTTVTQQASSASTGSGGSATSVSSSTVVSSSSSSTTGSTSSSSGAIDAGPDVDTTYPGPFPPPPQVVTLGGPTVAAPNFVPVFFSGDDSTFVGQLTDFTSKVGGTKYWTAAVSEYGVGAGVSAPPINLTETAPTTIDDTAIQTWLAGKLGAGDPDAGADAGPDPAWPQPDANTIYVLYYPAGTTITLQGSSSCTEFGGYHSDTVIETASGPIDVAYAVVPRCPSFGDLVGIDGVTGAASHELAEATTDPHPESNSPSYVEVDNAHFYWERILGGGEVGDMCAQFPTSFTKFTELDYTVQRIWSNKAALAGHDPCQPIIPGTTYFNAAPVFSDNLTVMFAGETLQVKGAKIALNASKTIPIELFSDGPIDQPWTVTVENATQQMPGAMPALSFAQDVTSGLNGDKIMLTITVNVMGKRGTESFIVKSTSADGTQENIWLGIVGQM